MRRLLLVFLLIGLPLVPARADALTLRDIVDLSKAGLGDEVLLALLEVDPTVFSIDTATLKWLKESGVSQKVIIAMIRSGRTPPPPLPEPIAAPEPEPVQQPPQVVVIDHREPEVREVIVPVYVPVVRHVRGSDRSFSGQLSPTQTRFIPTTGLSAPPPPPPVYWGSGGKLRPDAWKPTPTPAVPDRKPDGKPDRKERQ